MIDYGYLTGPYEFLYQEDRYNFSLDPMQMGFFFESFIRDKHAKIVGYERPLIDLEHPYDGSKRESPIDAIYDPDKGLRADADHPPEDRLCIPYEIKYISNDLMHETSRIILFSSDRQKNCLKDGGMFRDCRSNTWYPSCDREYNGNYEYSREGYYILGTVYQRTIHGTSVYMGKWFVMSPEHLNEPIFSETQ